MKKFNCNVCGLQSFGSKNKMYCSPACKQKAHRLKAHPFSGCDVKVKSNSEIIASVSKSISCAEKVIDICEHDIYAMLINGLIESGFRFPNEDIQQKTFEMLLDFNPETDERKKSVYCALFSDGLVKIGCSINVEFRLKTIEGQSGRSLVEFHCVEFEMRSEATKAESEIFKELESFRLNGEWFDVDYQLAKDKVFAYAETVKLPRLN